jgi:hypothetical protein
VSEQEIKDLIAEAILDSLEPDWNSWTGAAAVLTWLDEAGLCIEPKCAAPLSAQPGSNEWLAQSPQFHPGDIA